MGIAATTAIFTLIHGILLAPLPYAGPAALRAIGVTGEQWDGRTVYAVAPWVFDEIRGRTRAWSGVAAVAGSALVLREGEVARLLHGAAVSHESFEVMGVPLAKGDPASRIEDVRAVIHARDPAVPIVYAQPMTALYAAPFANSECFCCCWAR